MIKSVVRCPDNMVLVFDEQNEQVPEYQGWYEEMKDKIMQDAPPDAVFGHLIYYKAELKEVPRSNW